MKQSKLLLLGAMLSFTVAEAQVTPTVQMETLTRGVMAMPAQERGIYVSWRLLGTDDAKTTTFNLLRDGKLIARNICGRTNFVDPNGSVDNRYQVVTLVNGQEVATSEAATPWTDKYKVIQLDRPASGVDDVTGETYTYTPNDCSTGDVDGDGEYEIIVKWIPSNKTDNAGEGRHPGNEYIDCYRLNGEKLWRIDMGINILAGDHHTQYLVYDFDKDGKSELIMRTAPGGKDGLGNYVNQVADDATIKAADNTRDWRASGGAKIVGGQEYLTVFEGATGKAIHTIFYNPNRDGGYGGAASGTVLNWDDRSGKKDYVASYGNRGNRFLAAVAYLDGADKRPSAVMCRGYYTYSYLWAVDFDGEKLTHKWLHGSVSKTKVELTDANMKKTSRTYNSNTFGTSSIYTAYGQGNHNLSVADVDADGCDEIIYGSATIDNDGWLLYSTGLGHGDAMHVADMIPSRPGYEVFRCNESSPYGIAMFDARTGEVIFHQTADGDTGRGLAADISDQYEGYEFWGPKGNNPRETASGEFNTVISSAPSMNFRIYWDGDLQDELFDGSLNSSTGVSSPRITDWDGSKFVNTSVGYNNSQSCNWTKATPCLQADIMGDWREEMIMWNKNDPSQLNIIATNIESQHRVPTLMHDHNYRMAIAWQNVAYNQPPHLGYYLAGTNFNIEGEEEFLEEVKPEDILDNELMGENVLMAYTFEKGEAADYWKRGNGTLVEPTFDGSTGSAASIVASADRADFFLTPADFTGVTAYSLDLDLAIVQGNKTAYFTVMSQSAPDEVANNWGWFWVTTSAEVHNPYLFELTIPAGTTATVNEQIFEGETERKNQGTWTFTSSHWYHLTLSVNVPTATVNYQMKDKANGATVLEGTYTLRTGESPLIKGIYERNNRNGYDPGAILIDNVVITKTGSEDDTTEPEFTPADANNDGLIAIDDVVLTINALLGDMADNFVFAAADMNGDNRIMIDDVVMVINHLLGLNTASVMSTNDVACESLGISETQNGFGMNLSNATNYTAMQFDMTIPEGVSINDIRVTSGTDHSVAFRENGNGQMRVVVASLSNELFTSANLLDVAVTAESVANIHITNVYAATPDGVKVKVSDAEVNLTTTGIQQVGVEIAPTLFYDLTGRQLNGVPTRPGIYISNGKKVVIK